MIKGPWSEDEDRRLILGREAGLTYRQIIDLALPGRTEEQCSSRAGRLGVRASLRGPSHVAPDEEPISITKHEIEWRRMARRGSERYYAAVEAYMQKCRMQHRRAA